MKLVDAKRLRETDHEHDKPVHQNLQISASKRHRRGSVYRFDVFQGRKELLDREAESKSHSNENEHENETLTSGAESTSGVSAPSSPSSRRGKKRMSIADIAMVAELRFVEGKSEGELEELTQEINRELEYNNLGLIRMSTFHQDHPGTDLEQDDVKRST